MVARRFGLIIGLCMALAACGTVPHPKSGHSAEVSVDQMLDQLRLAASKDEAQGLQVQIRRYWAKSGKSHADAQMGRAAAAIESNNLHRALSYISKALEIAPDFAEAYYMRAMILAQLQNYDASVVALAKVLSLEPRHFSALETLGMVMVELERWDLATASFDYALSLNPHLESARERRKIAIEMGRGQAL